MNKPNCQEGVRSHQSYGFVAKKTLYSLKACFAKALFHLAEMSFSRHLILVAANHSQVVISAQPLHQVLHVRDLLQLPKHQRS